MKSLILLTLLVVAAEEDERPTVMIVVGAPGAPEYGEPFREWADRWQRAAEQNGVKCLRFGDGPAGEETDLARLEALLAAEPKQSAEALWLVLLGHGTFDGRVAKFNLRGSDVSAAQLAQWLAPFKRPVAVVNCASASAPFINRLSGPGRAIVTATKSGFEYNYARFGDFLSKAIADPAADLDKDEQTSLLEAFLSASAGVVEFYQQEARLATETALIDDNGDRLGTPAGWFRGTRTTRRAKDDASPDGSLAGRFHLARSRLEQRMPPEVRARRDELERALAALRQGKTDETDEDAYYARLEPLLVELARLYADLEKPAVPAIDLQKDNAMRAANGSPDSTAQP
ncbi:MAG: hypothetical protein ACYTG0_41635 [Planctomycetota bacterium]